jgi:PhnB protein
MAHGRGIIRRLNVEGDMATAIPDGYHTLTPYLIVPDGEGMLRFLQDVFAAKLMERFNRPDGTLKHSELQVGDSKIMVGQVEAKLTPRPQTLYVYLPDVDAAYKRALGAGAKSLMEVTDQFYGDRSGGFEDAAGNWWYVATHVEDVSPEELQRRAKAQELHAK